MSLNIDWEHGEFLNYLLPLDEVIPLRQRSDTLYNNYLVLHSDYLSQDNFEVTANFSTYFLPDLGIDNSFNVYIRDIRNIFNALDLHVANIVTIANLDELWLLYPEFLQQIPRKLEVLKILQFLLICYNPRYMVYGV